MKDDAYVLSSSQDGCTGGKGAKYAVFSATKIFTWYSSLRVESIPTGKSRASMRIIYRRRRIQRWSKSDWSSVRSDCMNIAHPAHITRDTARYMPRRHQETEAPDQSSVVADVARERCTWLDCCHAAATEQVQSETAHFAPGGATWRTRKINAIVWLIGNHKQPINWANVNEWP